MASHRGRRRLDAFKLRVRGPANNRNFILRVHVPNQSQSLGALLGIVVSIVVVQVLGQVHSHRTVIGYLDP